ncbi:GGDEF domain-containing protein [uncultured Sphingomonas sp.]|uniref:GGDEF domain-containing protein n=1 Tax=uncultured Sphingomonas sp. TaxID=158754 RepID=UPI0025D73E33|nr:GGDEF domain-containing protein [uncultured Sphingomonas sp.]
MKRIVLHDRVPSGSSAKRKGWLRTLFGSETAEGDPPAPEAADMLPPRAMDSELAVLAAQLAHLIGSARERLDGAMEMVDRSADEAADYGRALNRGADALTSGQLPPEAMDGLLTLTRAMIERTDLAEQKLRSTNAELRALQRDLSLAQESAERDPLTGLLNRRALEQALARAVETAQRTDAALAIALCDIDHLTGLNDAHGQDVGDRVLRLVGESLAANGDGQTFAGRQGGGEFVLLFEDKAVIPAAAAIDTVREAFGQRFLRSRSDGAPIGNVTFSAGVAGLVQGEDGNDLLRRADHALRRAKDSGRNQVMIDSGD